MARSRIEIAADALDLQSDADLAVRAAQGDREAFEELYRRHSRTAMRVAYRVTGNIHDASDAVSDAFARVMQALPAGRLTEPTRFRSYLLTATRHASVDVLRRAGRAVPSDEPGEPAETSAGPHELLMDAADSSLVAAAFRALPERWRSVLWLTEVEGVPARDAAGMLGVSPNGVAQLAVRARNGLRERYLQAHLREVDGRCRQAVERLGAYVGGQLAARDLALVDQHLADCEACREREAELRDVGTTLRRALVPVPVAGAGTGIARWFWNLLTSRGDQAASRVVPVGVAAASVLVAGLASVGIVHNRVDGPGPSRKPAPVAAAAPRAAALTPVIEAVLTHPDRTAAAPAPSAVTAAQPATTPTETAAAPAPATADSKAATPTTAPLADHRDNPPGPGPDPAPPTTLITLPPVTIPQVPTTLPPVTIPAVTIPPVSIPDVTLPSLPDLSGLPSVPLPDVPALLGEFQYDVLFAAIDSASSFLAFFVEQGDAPLPSPAARGLPV